jgi:hypothetical protein
LGPKSARYKALFIGVLDRIIDDKNPNTFLDWIELYLVKIQKKSRRGESGSVTITETGFSAGLAWVMMKTLSGSG